VPLGGLPTWSAPAPTAPPAAPLPAGLEIEVVARSGGWAQVRCSNEWTTWLDGDRLASGNGPAAPSGPPRVAPTQVLSEPSAQGSRAGASTPLRVGVGEILAAASAVAIILGCLLDWIIGREAGSALLPDASGFSLAADYRDALSDLDTQAQITGYGLQLLYPAIALTAVGAFLRIAGRARALARGLMLLGGSAALVAAGSMFAIEGTSLEVLGTGWWVVVAGGVGSIVAALIPRARPPST
jgi:hypothetical protein